MIEDSRVIEWTHPNPYLSGSFAPVQTEIDADRLEIDGALPKDLAGVYVRNSQDVETTLAQKQAAETFRSQMMGDAAPTP